MHRSSPFSTDPYNTLRRNNLLDGGASTKRYLIFHVVRDAGERIDKFWRAAVVLKHHRTRSPNTSNFFRARRYFIDCRVWIFSEFEECDLGDKMVPVPLSTAILYRVDDDFRVAWFTRNW